MLQYWKKMVCSFILLLTGYLPFAQQPLSTNASIARLEKDIPGFMKRTNVPGMSVALIRDGKLVWTGFFGVMNADTKVPVTKETIFEANSLSKPVFGYAVLKLVDEGKLNLDTPLNAYLENKNEFSDDPRINLVTARMVLSHTSGLQSAGLRGSDKMIFGYSPGEKFKYAPVAITYLSLVVERITGMKFEDFMKQTILDPLGMNNSSYVWKNKYDSLRAYRHDWQGHPDTSRFKWKRGAACCSLQTTADDYAKFVIAVLDGVIIKKGTWDEMLRTQITVDNSAGGPFWGLGWGLEKTEEDEAFWHWGDAGTSKAYITAFVHRKNAVVFFANGENGLSFAKEVLNDAIGGDHAGLSYLDYPRYDAPSWILLSRISSKGATMVLKDYERNCRQDSTKALGESSMNAIGYQLLNAKKIDDAIAVFTQNCKAHPQSWNTWDSLAEGYMDKGDKDLAIKYYERSLALNPGNGNAVEQLKKLKP